MKTFEIFSESKKKGQNGRRKFKAILYQIYPDSCIDEENQVGTQYNKNGITWIREYCEKALPSIKGMSLKCEFLDEERTELCGHGMTDTVDGLAIFENAVVIGTFSDGYIDEVELPNGDKILACIGVGEIDSSCYHNFCEKLDEDISNGIYPSGSVEILRTSENSGIVYKYGYKDYGRIPTEFVHSGYALLGVTPSDKTAKLVELNQTQKEDTHTMTDNEVKMIVEQTVSAAINYSSEINQCKEECAKKINEANAATEILKNEKAEVVSNSEVIQAALDDCRKELDEAYKKIDTLYEELNVLKQELGEAKAKERIGEMNAAIESFSDDEKAYAKAEMDAFNADPISSEINSVVNKIWEGIGKKAKENTIAEINSAQKGNAIEDIFGSIEVNTSTQTDVNIF